MALKQLIPRRLYGLRGNSIEAQFTLFKADLFNNGVEVAVDLNGAVATALTISGATTTSVSITGAATTIMSITGLHTTGIAIGSSGTPITYTSYAEKAIAVYATCDDTDGSDNFEPVLLNTVMTGAGQVGGRVRVNMQTNVALGGWANALKASVDCQTSGKATGLLSVFCAELTVPGSAVTGHMTVLELELVTVASYTATRACSLIYTNISGDSDADDSFLLNGVFIDMTGMGTADTDENIFHTTDASPTHALRCRIDDVDYDILLSASTYDIAS